MLIHYKNRFYLKNFSFMLPDYVFLMCDEENPYELIIGVPNANWCIEVSCEQIRDGASQFFLDEEDRYYFSFVGQVQAVSLNGVEGFSLQYGNARFRYCVYHFPITGDERNNVFAIAVRMDPKEKRVEEILKHPVVTSFFE